MADTSSEEGRAFFEQQRVLLIQDVAASMENVLQNINKLNRSLEGVIAVGNEFSQVEGLWSQFENVMAKQPSTGGEKDEQGKEDAKEGAEGGV
ncbi:hypothetical protein CB0940_06840 [Cercospora beticola]|uniref:DASH complex subunit DAD1 n=1 Tax=Cercospora beticola TaxID=122368 RepID=A0A2G5H994_CERBT|nr:hypothetical protein CB0940_06840 [Cercospora beticola]PIA89091.1 hypothetical protein CB0940_06840 [Cercospora beticola]WPB02756.1 hypothetical protein RHO25_007392 [Cercospora beticola]CAK1358566.1 unnamed protein product [Cercospora beticola]